MCVECAVGGLVLFFFVMSVSAAPGRQWSKIGCHTSVRNRQGGLSHPLFTDVRVGVWSSSPHSLNQTQQDEAECTRCARRLTW